MDPRDVMTSCLSSLVDRELRSSGREMQQLYNIFDDEGDIEPLIATLFWQIFIASPAYPNTLRRAGASRIAITQGDAMVVSHGLKGKQRYNLLIFDPAFPRREPVGVSIEASASELREGWMQWKAKMSSDWLESLLVPRIASKAFELFERRGRGAGHDVEDWLEAEQYVKEGSTEDDAMVQFVRIVQNIGPSFAAEAAAANSFGVVVARPPMVEYTAVPTPRWGVAAEAGGHYTSTVGVLATDDQRRKGVTVALHALPADVVPSVTTVCITGMNKMIGTVQSINDKTDSCFVELQGDFTVGSLAGKAGPLIGVSPRENEQVTFDGSVSGKQTTTVIAWDPDVFLVHPFVTGSKVYTTPVTIPGDSGAALVDADDHVLGFAYYRTGIGEAVEFSAWIWAHSVYRAHKLTWPYRAEAAIGPLNQSRELDGGPVALKTPVVTSPSIVSELEKLAELRAKGALSDEEFQIAKRQVLNISPIQPKVDQEERINLSIPRIMS
jgi:hypothetical protein